MISNRIFCKKFTNFGLITDRDCQCSRTFDQSTYEYVTFHQFCNHSTFIASGGCLNTFDNYGVFITKGCGSIEEIKTITVRNFKNYGTLIVHECSCMPDSSQLIRTKNFTNYGTIIRCHTDCRRSSVVITEIVEIPSTVVPPTPPANLPPETATQPKRKTLALEASQQPKRSRLEENSEDSSDLIGLSTIKLSTIYRVD